MRKPLPLSIEARYAINACVAEHAVRLNLAAADRLADAVAYAPGPYSGFALILSGPYGKRSVFVGHRRRREDPISFVLAAGDVRTSHARDLKPVQLSDADGNPAEQALVDDMLSDLLHYTHAGATGYLAARDPREGIEFPRGARPRTSLS